MFVGVLFHVHKDIVPSKWSVATYLRFFKMTEARSLLC